MSLKLTLRPGESVFVGTTRVTVEAESTCTVYVSGEAPILRASDMLEEADATEPVARFRYVLQEMYLSDDFAGLVGDYVDAVSQLLAEQPDLAEAVREANQKLRVGKLYEAVKIGKRLTRRRSA